MKKKEIISASIVAVLLCISLLTFLNQNIDECTTPENNEKTTQNELVNYSNHLEFNQEMIGLEKEVVQFQIQFHRDDVINVSLKMFVSYVDETITSGYCVLTDGEKPLLEPRGVYYIPERKYVIVTPRIRLSLGKFWLINFLNNKAGKIRFGSVSNDSGRFEVQKGDYWYMTLAVPTSSEKSGFSLILKSLYNSMEVNQVTRQSNLGFYSANYNQFSGKYYEIKLGLLGGLSVCDVSEEITIKNGSIIDISVAGHRKGNVEVFLPNGEEIQINEKGFIHYVFLGKTTGKFKVAVKGLSIYYMMNVVFQYIDIDPHVTTNYSTKQK